MTLVELLYHFNERVTVSHWSVFPSQNSLVVDYNGKEFFS